MFQDWRWPDRQQSGTRKIPSEEAIYRARAFLASSSVDDPLYLDWSNVLERASKNRFKYFGPIDNLETTSSSDPLPPLPLPASVVTAQKTWPLEGLRDGIRNHSITDIEEAVELSRSILATSDPSDLRSPRVFADVLFEAFERTKNIDYLNESILTLRQLLARRPPTKLARTSMIARLWAALYQRFEATTYHSHQITCLLSSDAASLCFVSGRAGSTGTSN